MEALVLAVILAAIGYGIYSSTKSTYSKKAYHAGRRGRPAAPAVGGRGGDDRRGGEFMASLAKLLAALLIVGVLGTVLANSVLPLAVVAAVGYALFHVWLGLNS